MSSPKEKAELHSDAWERFERVVDVVAKSPPQHRTKDKKSPAPMKGDDTLTKIKKEPPKTA